MTRPEAISIRSDGQITSDQATSHLTPLAGRKRYCVSVSELNRQLINAAMPPPTEDAESPLPTTFCPFKAPSRESVPLGHQLAPLTRFDQRPGFSLSLATFPAISQATAPSWPCRSYMQIAYLSQGSLDLDAPGGAVETVRSGEWFLLKPAGRSYQFTTLAPCRLHWIDCDADATSSLVGFSDTVAPPLNEPDRPYFVKGIAAGRLRLLGDQLATSDGTLPSERLRIESRTLEWLSLLLDEPAFSPCRLLAGMNSERDERALEAAARILQDRPHESHSIAGLSRAVHLNEFKLKKGFRERYNTTVFGYLRQIRMELARTHLSHGRLSVIEVANAVGYSNPSHFAKAFRDAFGINPAAYATTATARPPASIPES